MSCHHENHMKRDMKNSHDMMISDFKKRLWLSLVLTLPILILTPFIQTIFNYSIKFPNDQNILFLLSSIIFFYGGYPFLKGAYQEILEKNIGMMMLIATAILSAYIYSSFSVFLKRGDVFFLELATLIDIMLFGHIIEMKSVIASSRSLELLIKLMPMKANLIKNGKESIIDIEKLKIHDIVIVKPGEKIPADGVVTEGESFIDESLITGESKPVKKEKGSNVIAGSINQDGSIFIEVKNLGKDSYLSKVIKLVDEAKNSKSKTQKLADVAAKWLTYISLFVGILTFFSWIILQKGISFGIERAVTVMVISCPHALGLAIPLVVAISTTLLAKNGLLIRNRVAFENARKINAIAFDKTGTLTYGIFGLKNYDSISKNYSKEDILQIVSSLEKFSEHPIGRAIIVDAKNKKIDFQKVDNFKAMRGEGIEGDIKGEKFRVVSSNFIEKNKISLKENILANTSDTLIYLLKDLTPIGFLTLADEIRKESFLAIEKLKEMKIKTYMITGDREDVAKEVATSLKLDGYFANILPHQKLEIVKQLQQKGEIIAMTGDGINDAPALSQADVGIAIGSGTDIAAESADIILVRSNPLDILSLIEFSKTTYSKMIQNLSWALAYNLFAIPLAAGILYSYGIVIKPAFGAVLMSLSTIIVAINARFLKFKKFSFKKT